MIITLPLIIITSTTILITTFATGYYIGDRRRLQTIQDEAYYEIINYITITEPDDLILT